MAPPPAHNVVDFPLEAGETVALRMAIERVA